MPFADEAAKRAYHKSYYEKNKARGWNKHLKNETPEQRDARLKTMREYALKREFGITAEQYREMYEKQNGLCAICKEPPKAKAGRHAKVAALAVDHCHATGRVRKLLCTNCNLTLGAYETNKSAIDAYLASESN